MSLLCFRRYIVAKKTQMSIFHLDLESFVNDLIKIFLYVTSWLEIFETKLLWSYLITIKALSDLLKQFFILQN